MLNIYTITDFNLPELDFYARLSERQLAHFYEPAPGLFIAESPKVIERALDAGFHPLSLLVEDRQMEGEAACLISRLEKTQPSFPVYTASFETLKNLTGFALTRGALCAMQRKSLPDPLALCRQEKVRRIAVMENVVNPTNVGAIFRSAAALGMDAVFLTRGCSDPLYRRSLRVSMGTVFQIPWTYLPQDPLAPERMDFSVFKELGIKTAAMALTDRSVSVEDQRVQREERLAILLGTEGEGLYPETIKNADYTVKIPMSHGVDSLNVAAASAVAFWTLRLR